MTLLLTWFMAMVNMFWFLVKLLGPGLVYYSTAVILYNLEEPTLPFFKFKINNFE